MKDDVTEIKWQRWFWWLLTAVTVWRLAYLFITPLDLVPDEAYYWDWGRHLAWGYYSKPPMIAWINALSSAMLGATPFSVRLPAVLCGSLTLIALYGLACRMFDARTAFWSVTLAVLAPGSAGINLIMTIDAPLVCCWALALYFLWRGLEDDGRPLWIFLTILACGIGLLAKQMMLFFPLITLLYLALNPDKCHHLRRPWPYLLLIVPLIFLFPDLWWNSQHGWITMHHTAHHFEGNHTFWRLLTTLPDFIGSQLLLIAPLTWIIFIALAVAMARRFRALAGEVKFLLLFSALPLVIFTLMSLRQRINANWPAVFYCTAFVLTAAWVTDRPLLRKTLASWRRLFPWAVYSAIFLSLLVYFLTFYVGYTALGGGPKDPFHRLKGWHELGIEVSAILQEQPGNKNIIVAVSRQTASELAFYVKGQPQVYLWNNRRHTVSSQYDLWPGPTSGGNALLVVEKGKGINSGLRRVFQHLELLKELRIPMGPAASRDYTVYLGRNLLEWPQ